MENLLNISAQNMEQARQIIRDTRIIPIWESVGAEINLVGSLKMGLISFAAIAKLADHPAIKQIEYINSINTDEHCIEWHASYLAPDNTSWQIDMIHILKGSRYDGYFERVAERIAAVLTPETRNTILQLKYETPDTEKIMGIEYYQAVIQDGIRTYADFIKWRENHPTNRIIEWIP